MAAIGEFPKTLDTKYCAICGAVMPKSALKCVKCGSYQGWQRMAAANTTVLALVTALLSVATVSVPSLFNLLRPDHSDINVAYGGDDTQGGIFLLVANGGTAPGAIAKVELNVTIKHRDFHYLADPSPETVPTVLPKSSSRMRYMIDVGRDMEQFTVKDAAENTEGCSILVSTFEFNNNNKSIPFVMGCNDLRPLGLMSPS